MSVKNINPNFAVSDLPPIVIYQRWQSGTGMR